MIQQTQRGPLFFIVFCSGFIIAAIEISLGRLLAPYFGASLSIWAGIIASVILALAIGYYLGGRLIDQRPVWRLPLFLLAVGGVLGCVLGVLAPYALQPLMHGVAFGGAGFWGRLIAVLMVFALPCITLAAIPPAVLRLVIVDTRHAGQTSGWIYALGSLASVLGILLTALWFIPVWGIRSTFLILGLVALAPWVLALGKHLLPGKSPLLFVLFGVLLTLYAVPEPLRGSGRAGSSVVLDEDTGLQRVRVLERQNNSGTTRWLQFNEGFGTHSKHVEPGLISHGYWDWLALAALLPEVEDDTLDVLIIGLAAGTTSNIMSRYLAPHFREMRITGVELDPRLVDIARQYFALDECFLEVVVGDGRVWLNAATEAFDLIIVDAYEPAAIPAHMATREFFLGLREHLSPGGVALINIYAPLQGSPVVQGLAATWTSVFPNAHVLTGLKEGKYASRLFFGQKHPQRKLAFAEQEKPAVPLLPAWRYMRHNLQTLIPDANVTVWTDDRVPIELWMGMTLRKSRPTLSTRSDQG